MPARSCSSASAVGLAVDLDVDQRLGQPVLGPDLEQPALLVAPDAHDRPDHEVDGAPAPRHLHRDRVDEEGHVVDDRLDDGVRRLPAVLLDVRRVDVHLDLAGPADAREVPVGERGAVEVDVAPVVQVVGRDVGVVRADEPLDLFRLRAWSRSWTRATVASRSAAFLSSGLVASH